VSHKSNSILFAVSQLDWPIAKRKVEPMDATKKIEDSMEKWSASPFGPPI
jgi:hypothetical protein